MRPSLILRAAGVRKTPGLQQARKATRRAVLPLAHQLAENDSRTGAAATRADIVSPALCDDILSCIGPSLEPYKHCDIVDVNPGAGLWSSRLHEFLKPRRHVLLEPDAFYKPFLQPLYNQPDSKYVSGPSHETTLQSLAATLENGLLPDQHTLKHGDPGLNQPNKSLLLLINLSRYKAPTTRSAYFVVRETLNVLTSTAWTHTGIHKYGQVRMLVWIGDYFEDKFVPKDLNQVDPYGFSFQHRTQTHVVASADKPRMPREETTTELSSAVRALVKMRKLGLELPPNRQSWLHQKALSLLETRSVDDVQAELKSNVAGQFADDEIKSIETQLASGALKSPLDVPWQTRLAELKKITPRGRNVRETEFTQLKPLWAQFDEYYRLESTVVDESQSAQERLAAKEKMEKLGVVVKKQARKQNKMRQQIFFKALDDRRAFYHDPPLLSWDSRPFEPLRTEPHEFFPQQSLSLLDITPKPAPRDYSQGDLAYWQRFADRMFERTSATVSKALNSMRAGSPEIILPQVRAVHDPRRGGSLDVEDMRIRKLTPEMMDEIVDAWRSWAFRPETLEKYFLETRLDWFDLVEGTKNVGITLN
ncbi:hypothetical protein SLS57_008550 [Botryosphaeria dothidea]